MKMLMKITLPKMEELLVTMVVMISPYRREVSPAEQLRRSPRLVPLHPESLLMIFSRSKHLI